MVCSAPVLFIIDILFRTRYPPSMFVRVKDKNNGKKSIQIVEAHRSADKVSQHIVRHVGQAFSDREIEELKRLAESIIIEMKNNRQPVLPMFSPEEIYNSNCKECSDETVKVKNLREEQRVIEGIADVFGELHHNLGFDELIKGTKQNAKWNGILKSCIMARLANPVSKRRTASLLEEDYGIKIPLDSIYKMMDHVFAREEEIKKHISQTTLNLFQQKVDVLLFDVTTLYFESVWANGVRDFGFSKDCKFKEVQVVLALVTTTEGLPISYEVFPGNMYEGHTLIEMVRKLKSDYKVEHILLVADRAMFNEDNLKAMDAESVEYIVAAKLKSFPKEMKKQIIEENENSISDIGEETHLIYEHEYKSRRLIVDYSTARAGKDAIDRQRLIDRLIKKVKNGKIKLKDIIPNHGTKKYLQIIGGEATVNEAKIAEDSRWDGIHGVITNIRKKPAKDLLERYGDLWRIEESFRINKHDLKMRPIYHWTSRRIKAHIAICFIAYTLAKQATYRLGIQQTPMSFGQLRNELLHVQSSVMIDVKTKKQYRVPSHVTANQRKIYQVFGLKRSEVPSKI